MASRVILVVFRTSKAAFSTTSADSTWVLLRVTGAGDAKGDDEDNAKGGTEGEETVGMLGDGETVLEFTEEALKFSSKPLKSNPHASGHANIIVYLH